MRKTVKGTFNEYSDALLEEGESCRQACLSKIKEEKRSNKISLRRILFASVMALVLCLTSIVVYEVGNPRRYANDDVVYQDSSLINMNKELKKSMFSMGDGSFSLFALGTDKNEGVHLLYQFEWNNSGKGEAAEVTVVINNRYSYDYTGLYEPNIRSINGFTVKYVHSVSQQRRLFTHSVNAEITTGKEIYYITYMQHNNSAVYCDFLQWIENSILKK